MNDKRTEILRRFVIIQQNHWAIYPIVYFLMVAVSVRDGISTPGYVAWTLLGILSFGLYLIRSLARNQWVALILHLMMAALVIVMHESNSAYKFIFLFTGLFYCFYSYVKKCGRDEAGRVLTVMVPVVISGASLLCTAIMKIDGYTDQMIIILIVNIVLYFLAIFTERFHDYIKLNRHSIGYMPTQSIFGEDMKMLAVFMTGLGLLFVIIVKLKKINVIMDRVVDVMLGGLGIFLQKLLRMFQRDNTGFNEPDQMGELFGTIAQPDQATNPFWDLLFNILFYVMLIYIVFKVFKALGSVVGFFMHFPGLGKEEEQEEEEEVEEVTESIRVSPVRKLQFFQVLSPEKQIRRSFKNRVSASREVISGTEQTGYLDLYTARECAQKLESRSFGDLYEKARYSPYECTGADAKLMKQICQHLKKNRR